MGKYTGFPQNAVLGLMDTVAVLGGRNGGGKTKEGDNMVMRDTDGEDDPSERQRWLLRRYVSKVLKLLLDLLSFP